MLKENEQIQELINLKSNQISEKEGSLSNTDLDESWEKAEEHVINLFLDNYTKAEDYAWEGLENTQPEFEDLNYFICILGFVMTKNTPTRLTVNVRNQNYYKIGLSFLTGIFCFARPLIVEKAIKRKEFHFVFQNINLICQALRHFIHTNPDDPYFNYFMPFTPLEGKTDKEIEVILKTDKEWHKFLAHCEEEHRKLYSKMEKMFKL